MRSPPESPSTVIQDAAAKAYCKTRGLTLDEELRDEGISAYRGKNAHQGALMRFLDLVESGDIPRGSHLIVESLDRISRQDVMAAMPRFMELINSGITIATLADGQTYSREKLANDWTPLIMSLAIMARANEESKTKGHRMTELWEEKKRSAIKGVVYTAMCPANNAATVSNIFMAIVICHPPRSPVHVTCPTRVSHSMQ